MKNPRHDKPIGEIGSIRVAHFWGDPLVAWLRYSSCLARTRKCALNKNDADRKGLNPTIPSDQ